MTNCFSQHCYFLNLKSDGSLSGRHLCVSSDVSSETSHRNNLSHIKGRHGEA